MCLSGFTFEIQKEDGSWTYSFAGHRFRVALQAKDPYVQALIRGHHDYSTREVINAACELQKEESTRFPEDLFLLMMADQLEAELAVRCFQGAEGEVRPFVDFDLLPHPQEKDVYLLDPWPFEEEEVRLDFTAYFRPLGDAKPEDATSWGRELAEALAEGREPEGFRREGRSAALRPWPAAREGGTWEDARGFYYLFKLEPNEVQRAVFEAAKGDLAHLLLAPTGTGKTEAAAFPALARGERLVLVLPTRSLIDDLELRFLRYLQVLAREEHRAKRLVVDTGGRQVRHILHPDGTAVQKQGQHLYHGEVILTTLDKLLYRYFGYAAGVKSYAFPRRIHDGRTLFVFDEVHLYEATAWVNFRHLVQALTEAGRVKIYV